MSSSKKFHEMMVARNKAMATHNETKTRLYGIWAGMKQRCFNEKDHCYQNYGARGITVCDEWKNDYVAFSMWAKQNGYTDELSIDRIDTNGNYEPSNCRWATAKTQARNKRNSIYLTYNGETKHITEWAEATGQSLCTLYCRKTTRGWSDAEVIEGRQYRKEIHLIVDGVDRTLSEWARITGQRREKLYTRHRRGWCDKEVVYGRQHET